MIRSFRLRLALSAALLAGLTLVVFALSALWLIRSVKIEHIDRTLQSDAEREAGRPPAPDGWERVQRDFAAGLGLRDASELLLLVKDAQGEEIYRSSRWPGDLDTARLPWPERESERPRPPPPDARPPARRPASTAIGLAVGGEVWRLGLASSDKARVAVAVGLHRIDEEMAGVRTAFLVAVPIALLLIGLGAWAISGRALRPIAKLDAAARRVTAEGLDQRIAGAGEDSEFQQLIEVFNGMLARLERSFEQTRRFSADAAHELKTPLAILQGQLERAINSAEAGSPLQGELTSILDEVRRLSTISRKLLLLSQADAGRLRLHREPFPLSEALTNLVEDTQMLAPSLRVTADIAADIVVSADGSLLQQALHNLISNAIKYNVAAGWIRISARKSGQKIEIQVANASQGIPAAERSRLFERFYRADPARSRQIEGVGLGLALSREIARAHGGELVFAVGEDQSVNFSLTLPQSV